MPTTHSPTEPHDFLQSFIDAYERAHLDAERTAAETFDWWFSNEYVFKGPFYLLIGGRDPDDPRDDTWFVYWAEVHPDFARTHPLITARLFLGLMPSHRPRVAWCRAFSGNRELRIYSTDRLLRLTWPRYELL